jgi:hypothetical protein
VALLEPDAVRVTLSHFCPAAASMLFRDDAGELGITPDAAGISDRDDVEGFDARQTIPPLLRPGVAADTGTCRAWEACVLRALDADGEAPEEALARIATATEAVRSWPAGRTTLERHTVDVVAASARSAFASGPWTMRWEHAARLFTLAVESVPQDLQRPAVPGHGREADREFVSPQWAARARPIRRYLAARSFGAWSAYLGEGLRTQAAMLAVALAAVRVEAVRAAAQASRPLDDALLHAAVRSADLLLHHLSTPAVLVRSLAFVEQVPPSAWLRSIGLEAAR